MWPVRIPLYFLIALLSWNLGIGQAADVVTITVEGNVGSWAVQESTGRLFASLPDADVVVEYDSKTGGEIQRIETPGGPREMIVKNQNLVVSCLKNSSFQVIDLATNKSLGKVQITGRGPIAMFCSQANNNYVYGFTDSSDSSSTEKLYQVDLKTLQIRKEIKTHTIGSHSVSHAVMSYDGRWFMPDGRGKVSPSGVNLIRVNEDEASFQSVKDAHESRGQVMADPCGRFWAMGDTLYPENLEGQVRSFNSGMPIALHPWHDLAVSPSGVVLNFYTISTGKSLAQVILENFATDNKPKKKGQFSGDDEGSNGKSDPTVRFDLAHERVIFGVRSQAFIVAIASTGLTPQPRLELKLPSRLTVFTSETRALPVESFHPQSFTEGSVELVSGPPFVKLSKAKLTVVPTTDDVGEYEIKILAKLKERTNEKTIKLTVEPPSVTLDLRIQGVTASPDGKNALVWGSNATANENDPRMGTENAADVPTEMAVIDLPQATLVRKQTSNSRITDAVLDEKNIYVTLANNNVLYRLGRDEKSSKAKVFLNGVPRGIRFLPENRIAVITSSQANVAAINGVQVFSRDTLEADTKHFLNRSGDTMLARLNQFCEPVGPNQLRGLSQVIDSTSGYIHCFVNHQPLPVLVDFPINRNERGFMYPSDFAENQPTLKGISRWQPFEAVKVNGRSPLLATLQNRGLNWMVCSTDYPVLAGMRHAVDQKAGERSLFIDLLDIQTGKTFYSVLLEKQRRWSDPHMSNFFPGQHSHVVFSGDRVLAFNQNKLWIITIPETVRQQAAPPLAIRFPELLPTGAEKPLEVVLQAEGGKSPYTFTLVRDHPQMVIDEKTGKLTIDLPKMWNQYLDKLRASSDESRPNFDPSNRRNPDLSSSPETYRLLTGAELPKDKRAYALPFIVDVTDAEQQRARIELSAIVLGPAADYERVKRERESERQKQIAEQQKIMELARQEQAKRNAENEAAKMQAAGGNDLEKRIRRLESALDAVLEKLDKLEQKIGDK